MPPQDKPTLEQKTWVVTPQRNHNSLVVTIPAAIRHQLRLHMNSPLVITFSNNTIHIRQVETLKALGVQIGTQGFKRRRKSWKRGPQEPGPKYEGYKLEPLPEETQET